MQIGVGVVCSAAGFHENIELVAGHALGAHEHEVFKEVGET